MSEGTSGLGVFQWLRDAVRRSVLLGFSDAVEQLGGAADASEPLHPQLAAALKQAAMPTLESPTLTSPSQPKRKRLGRSLDQFRHLSPKPADGNA
ncbi:MAG: hypothetical protein AB7O59_21355 [Pirellulales bacterium]